MTLSSHLYALWGSFRYRTRDLYWDRIRPLFAPQHAELRAAIPRTWMDLDECMVRFLYACVISYVEKEDGLALWEAQDPEHECRKRAFALREVYEWAKTGRAKHLKAIENAYPPLRDGWPVDGTKLSYHKVYGEVERLERELEEWDTRCMTWIVERRGALWS